MLNAIIEKCRKTNKINWDGKYTTIAITTNTIVTTCKTNKQLDKTSRISSVVDNYKR